MSPTTVAAAIALAIAPPGAKAAGPLEIRLRIVAGTAVELVLENRSDGPLSVPMAVALQLGHGSYWSPVSLGASSASPGVAQVTPATPGPPDPRRQPVRLAAHESKRVVIELTRLRWGRAAPGAWPRQPLAEAVPAGKYALAAELSFESSPTPVRSNEVTVEATGR
jgi:hypothetical protein